MKKKKEDQTVIDTKLENLFNSAESFAEKAKAISLILDYEKIKKKAIDEDPNPSFFNDDDKPKGEDDGTE